MAKGLLIPEDLERLVVKTYMTHPKMPAKDIQKEVSSLYRKDNPLIPKNWPGLSAIQKILQKVRLNHIPNPKDAPWSLYTLAEYDVSADALPVVLDAYAATIAWRSTPLTVREAKWVNRLYRVFDKKIEELIIAASECAENERLNELTGKPLPSLIDADLEIRALKGRPGISYNYLGKDNVQMVILDKRIEENIDIIPLPKRVIERDITRQDDT